VDRFLETLLLTLEEFQLDRMTAEALSFEAGHIRTKWIISAAPDSSGYLSLLTASAEFDEDTNNESG